MDGLGGVGAGGDVAGHGDALELFEEVEVEPGPAELTVGDGPHADRLELGDRVGDRDVLDIAQLGGRDLVGRALLAGGQHRWRAEQAADVVGAEGRVDRAHAKHDDSRTVGWSDPGPRLANAVRRVIGLPGASGQSPGDDQ